MIVDRIIYGTNSIINLRSLRKAKFFFEGLSDFGITQLDTAPIYSRGYSEEIIGRLNVRHKFKINTKFGLETNFPFHKNLTNPLMFIASQKQNSFVRGRSVFEYERRLITRKEVTKSFIESMSKLRVEHINAYLMHEHDSRFLTDEAKSFLLDRVKLGDIGQLGFAVTDINSVQKSEVNKCFNILQYGLDTFERKIIDQFDENIHHNIHSIYRNNDFKSDSIKRALNIDPSVRVVFSRSTLQKVRESLMTIL